MYLHSTNASHTSNTLEDNRKNIDQLDGSTKVAAQQEDLQLLAQILQEQLLAEVPCGGFFQVKCAVKNEQLIIVAQHAVAVQCNIETIFTVLEEALQSLPEHHKQQVELFLRVFGQKLPYAKRSLTLRGDGVGEVGEQGISPSSPSSPSSCPSPIAGVRAITLLGSKPAYSLKTILVGAALIIIAVFSGSAYFLTHCCVTFESKQIQTAKQLQRSLGQLKLSFKSEKELPKIQQQLDAASASLKTIPPWSPYYQEAEKLSASLSKQSEKIQQLRKAFQAGSTAAQKSQTLASSLQELKARQQLWRQAIAPLEAVNSNSELYKLVQPKLLIYRANLHTVKQQLLAEEKRQVARPSREGG
ncbi:hypothetical protein SAMD00079811_21130 [Scytonema sp. HK-05]|uniref:hypothetical protein n=1 Tax=Scytonema sp. HK-05 TaxID=1137095 RepID=UPI000935E3EA|nr:hypothetical protein [Scytonema sp. HK-05]OKH45458.1 hypothetical protein NIES2130_37280 [Scytonema sp. HK-05]BAY44513.1 hypothetical protein SAMD00079811_21130 [Scytonema sp. HK-05]